MLRARRGVLPRLLPIYSLTRRHERSRLSLSRQPCWTAEVALLLLQSRRAVLSVQVQEQRRGVYSCSGCGECQTVDTSANRI